MPNTASSLLATLAQADARKQTLNLTYRGAVTPIEAQQVLQADADAVLIDVRTSAELELVGRVPTALHLEWASYPGMIANTQFAAQLRDALAHKSQDTVIIFMCRTGGRSHNAAVVAHDLGFTHAYNMLEGFEGDANAQKQRTLINGWRHANLPWTHQK